MMAFRNIAEFRAYADTCSLVEKREMTLTKDFQGNIYVSTPEWQTVKHLPDYKQEIF